MGENASLNFTRDSQGMAQVFVTTQTALMFLIMFGTLVCNILVGIVIIRRTHHHNASPSNIFLLNLTIANTLLAILVLPLIIASMLMQRWIWGNFWCQACGFFGTLLTTDALLTVMVLSYDRYHYIVNPLSYPMRMSAVKTRVLVAYTWLQSSFTAILPLVGWGIYGFQVPKSSCTVLWDNPRSEGYAKLFSISVFIIPLVVMIWTYSHIMKAARRQARIGNIAVLNAGFRSSISSTGSGQFTGSKALRTTVLVLGTVIVFLGPYNVTILLESSGVTLPKALHITATILCYSISLLYPLIYGIRVKGIRRDIKRMVCSTLCCIDYVRPISAAEAFLISPAARAFRNRSVSDGSVCSINDLEAPRTETERDVTGWCLPPIREEIVLGRESHKPGTSTELTDLEIMSLSIPGQIMDKN